MFLPWTLYPPERTKRPSPAGGSRPSSPAGLALSGAAIGFSVLLTGCVAAPAATPTPEAGPPPQRVSAATLVRSACIDGTGSTQAAFATALKGHIADAVTRYMPPRPVDPAAGVDPVAGLLIRLRYVTATPTKFGAQFDPIVIHSVAGLPPRPDLEHSDGEAVSAWNTVHDAWVADRATAETDVRKALLEIEGLDVHPNTVGSNIAGCVKAHADTLTDPVTIGVFSDLRQNVPWENVLDLQGTRVMVIQPCPDGSTVQCRSDYDTFRRWALDHHAGSVEHAVPELAAQSVQEWLS